MKIFIFVILFVNLNAQAILNKTNLAFLCNCDPQQSKSISLFSKNIQTIDADTFEGISYIQYLSLAANQLTYIDPNTFNGIKFLRGLDLSANQFKKTRFKRFLWFSFSSRIILAI